MKIESAKQISDLYHKIEYIKGNMEAIQRYLKDSRVTITNVREDIGHLSISTYSCGNFSFIINEEIIVKAASEMFSKESENLKNLMLELESL